MVSRSRSLIVLLPLVALLALACPGVVSAAPTLITRDVIQEVNGLGWGSTVSQDKREVRFYRLPNPTPTVVQAGEGCEFINSSVRYVLRWCGAQAGNRLDVVNILTGMTRSLPIKWVADGRCYDQAFILSDYWLVVPLANAAGWCTGSALANWRTDEASDRKPPEPVDLRGPAFRLRGWLVTDDASTSRRRTYAHRYVWGKGRRSPILFRTRACCLADTQRPMPAASGSRQAWWGKGSIKVFTERSRGRPIARYRTQIAEGGIHRLYGRALPQGMFIAREEGLAFAGRYTGTWWVPRREVGY
jgi:hypothetical protein